MFNLDKAKYCAKEMKEYFNSFSHAGDVEIPANIGIGSNEHITYLFYSCLLDYGMRSKQYHNNLINTYEKNSNIFNPQYVVENFKNNETELLLIIKENIHPRYPSVALKKWLNLSSFLNENYPQDKLKEKIVSLKSYQELYNFITSINGFGQKTGGLLLRLIYELEICKFIDEMKNIPIDCHDIEISYLNGIVNKQKLNSSEIKELGEVWIEAASIYDISPIEVDKYLWSIGSNLCAKKKCDICPLNKNCKEKKNLILNT